jgi:hypothetical protein
MSDVGCTHNHDAPPIPSNWVVVALFRSWSSGKISGPLRASSTALLQGRWQYRGIQPFVGQANRTASCGSIARATVMRGTVIGVVHNDAAAHTFSVTPLSKAWMVWTSICSFLPKNGVYPNCKPTQRHQYMHCPRIALVALVDKPYRIRCTVVDCMTEQW